MRTRDEVSAEKLRGGFYSPDVLVDLCMERSRALLDGRVGIRVLEPCSGDGAFIRGVHRAGMVPSVDHIEAVELLADEAQKSARTLGELGMPGRIVNDNVLRWAELSASDFDLVLANPPYVRFQFISDEDKQRAKAISARLGATGSSVSNLWIPVFLLSLSKLREGGVFSVILPTEFLTGVSASAVRSWLLANTSDLSIDLFKPGTFPEVLQEVLVLTGRKVTPFGEGSAEVQFYDHNGGTRTWSHLIDPGSGTWTNYLLTAEQNRAFLDARRVAEVQLLRTVARFSVSTVTGANSYFCVPTETVEEYGLWEWAIPMLPRSRHASGLVFDAEDARALDQSDTSSWMLSFAAHRPDPTADPKSLRYLGLGKSLGIPERFKCRVRTPWYRVPVVPAGDLMLSKRSNRYPRVIANHAGVVTTDTIYRGQLLAGAPISANDFTATFHNSLTLLSAEIEGRSFGGGVLELVPSEVGSLLVPIVPGGEVELPALDRLSRESRNPEDLVRATDAMLSRLVPALDASTLSALADARTALMERRLQRTHSKFYG